MQAAANKNKLSGRAGFTLVEVVVSMVLMGMIFSSAFSAYMLGMDMINDAREELRASQIVHSELERLRTKSWSELKALGSSTIYWVDAHGEFAEKFASDYSAYVYALNNSVTGDDKILVLLNVQWTNSKGMTSHRVFSTVFVEGGLNTYFYRKA